MITPEAAALIQSYHEIPSKWYEDENVLNPRKPLEISKMVAVLILHSAIFFSCNDNIAYHLAAAGVYVAGAILDTLSTARGLDSMNKARAAGLSVFHEEANPLLKDVSTPTELIYNPKKIIRDVVMTGASFAVPPIGLTIGTGKFIASANNFRVAKRYNRACEILSETQMTK